MSISSLPQQGLRLPDHRPQEPRQQWAVEAGTSPGEEGEWGLGWASSLLVHLSCGTSSFSLPAPASLSPVLLGFVHGSWSVTLPALWVRTKENGSDRDPLHPDHLSKRPCTLSPAQRYSPSNGLPHATQPPHYRLEDMAMAHHFRDSYRHPDPRELRERHRQLGEQCAGKQGHAGEARGETERGRYADTAWPCLSRKDAEEMGVGRGFEWGGPRGKPHPAGLCP